MKKSKISTKDKREKVVTNYFNNNKENLPFIQIEDDIIIYIYDTLKWIRNDCEEIVEKRGLAYHGLTLIQDDNAEKLKKIIKAWAILFSLGDEEFTLEGSYVFEGMKVHEGEEYFVGGSYEKIIVKKRKLLKDLKKLIDMLEVVEKNAEYCVFHMGI
ncbi:hypothetical protein [Clostridium sp.]|uniref:hypothetical protein n=1 Tax=Clostridium sp. TaxID=1506 RepID=UPI003F662ED6